MEDEVDGFDVGDAGDSSEALGIRFFASLRMTRRRLPDGVEDEGEGDVGAGGVGVEFDSDPDGLVGFVPRGGLGDADQVLDGRGSHIHGGVHKILGSQMAAWSMKMALPLKRPEYQAVWRAWGVISTLVGLPAAQQAGLSGGGGEVGFAGCYCALFHLRKGDGAPANHPSKRTSPALRHTGWMFANTERPGAQRQDL